MRSHLLEGTVRHRRARPTAYALEHAVYYFGLDLDELDELPRRVPLVRRNRPWLVELRDGDHLPRPATDLRSDIRAHLRVEGLNPDGWRIELVTNLRVLGYVFNPASFFLCRDPDGRLLVVVVEVHNTHGERHLYTLRREADAGSFRAGMAKDFYVSPFIGPDGSYRVTVRDEGRNLRIGINEGQADGPILSTSLVLRRRPLTSRSLLRMLLRHPLITQRTIGLIHWHALRLWLRGVPFHRHSAGHQSGHPPAAALPSPRR